MKLAGWHCPTGTQRVLLGREVLGSSAPTGAAACNHARACKAAHSSCFSLLVSSSFFDGNRQCTVVAATRLELVVAVVAALREQHSVVGIPVWTGIRLLIVLLLQRHPPCE